MKFRIDKIDKFDSFFFDLDGTLLDTYKLNFHTYYVPIKRHLNIELDPQTYNKYFNGVPSKNAVKYFIVKEKIKCSDELLERIINEHKLHKLQLMKESIHNFVSVIDHSFKILDICYRKKKKLILVTSTRMINVQIFLKEFRVSKYFDNVISREDTIKSKPFSDCYIMARSLANSPSSKCIAFEDSKIGILSAKRSGISCVGVKNDHNSYDSLKECEYILDASFL